jgi:hypothetical protein
MRPRRVRRGNLGHLRCLRRRNPPPHHLQVVLAVVWSGATASIFPRPRADAPSGKPRSSRRLARRSRTARNASRRRASAKLVRSAVNSAGRVVSPG